MQNLKILFFGCGKMGSAIMEGAIKSGVLPKNIRAVDTSDAALSHCLARHVHGAKKASFFNNFNPSIVFIAVKPYCVADVLNDVKPFTDKGALVVTIAAGKHISAFKDVLGATTPVIRAMPNTPACIGKGVTGAVACANVADEQKAIATTLLETCGKLVWMTDETLLDAVTAVSGSGPAYVFYFVEQLAAAAKKAGIPDDLCLTLAKETVCGAADLMRASGEDPAVLRQNVTTPNGTTAAALAVFEKTLPAVMTEAVNAAQKRSEELAS